MNLDVGLMDAPWLTPEELLTISQHKGLQATEAVSPENQTQKSLENVSH